ncbi:MAG: hypothetical protein JWN75_623 [Candidatus Saccharibacteria bacterium]|nr:hypothetical protein [Candidatus Saccharibacteria bacterium]
MNKPADLSPLSIIEDIFYQKVKNTPFRVWHYYLALTLLCIVPVFLPQNSGLQTLLTFAIVAIAWVGSRTIGHNLSRNKNIDSILIYRFFAAAQWLIAVIATGLPLLFGKLDSLDQLMFTAVFYVSVVVSAMHILGIIIHLKKNKSMIKNIKKDELFQ